MSDVSKQRRRGVELFCAGTKHAQQLTKGREYSGCNTSRGTSRQFCTQPEQQLKPYATRYYIDPDSSRETAPHQCLCEPPRQVVSWAHFLLRCGTVKYPPWQRLIRYCKANSNVSPAGSQPPSAIDPLSLPAMMSPFSNAHP